MIEVLATLLALSQTAADPAPAAPSTTAPAGGPSRGAKPKLICEEDGEIGSRIAKKKVCMTKEEWREYRADNRQQMNRIQPMTGG